MFCFWSNLNDPGNPLSYLQKNLKESRRPLVSVVFEVVRKNLGDCFCCWIGLKQFRESFVFDFSSTLKDLPCVFFFWSTLKESRVLFVSGFWSSLKESRGVLLSGFWSSMEEFRSSFLFCFWRSIRESQGLFCFSFEVVWTNLGPSYIFFLK